MATARLRFEDDPTDRSSAESSSEASTPAHGRSTGWTAGLAVVAVIGAGLLAVEFSSPGALGAALTRVTHRGSSAAPDRSTSVAASAPPTGTSTRSRVVAPPSGQPPIWLIGGLGQGPLVKIDPGTDQVLATVDVGASPRALLLAFGSLWVSCGYNEVMQVDPVTNRVQVPIRIGGEVAALASDGTRLWVNTETHLVALDPGSRRVISSFKAREPLSGLAYDGKLLWSAGYTTNTLLGIDPATGSVVTRVPVGKLPVSISFDGTSLWVSNGGANSLSQVSPATAKVIRTFALGPAPTSPVRHPGPLLVLGTQIWLARGTIGPPYGLARLDTQTGQVAEQVPLGCCSMNMATDAKSIWVQTGSEIARVQLDDLTFSRTWS
jgi:PQQ-like domain